MTAPVNAPVNDRILVVQPETDDPPHLFGEWLEEAGARLEICRPYAGEPVPTADGYAGLLVMGGAMSANDDEVLEWVGPVKELIRDAVSSGVPTLGICLGHQLMGAALGGRVTPNPLGHQVVVPLDADRLLTDIKEARAELDRAWAPLAAGFADIAIGVPG